MVPGAARERVGGVASPGRRGLSACAGGVGPTPGTSQSPGSSPRLLPRMPEPRRPRTTAGREGAAALMTRRARRCSRDRLLRRPPRRQAASLRELILQRVQPAAEVVESVCDWPCPLDVSLRRLPQPLAATFARVLPSVAVVDRPAKSLEPSTSGRLAFSERSSSWRVPRLANVETRGATRKRGWDGRLCLQSHSW